MQPGRSLTCSVKLAIEFEFKRPGLVQAGDVTGSGKHRSDPNRHPSSIPATSYQPPRSPLAELAARNVAMPTSRSWLLSLVRSGAIRWPRSVAVFCHFHA